MDEDKSDLKAGARTEVRAPADAAGRAPRYVWPWFVLAGVVLAIVLAILWMSAEIARTKRNRIPGAPAGQVRLKVSGTATGVAQICNLLYRRFEIGRRPSTSGVPMLADARQNAILRYGRLQICATCQGLTDHSNRAPRDGFVDTLI